MENLIQNYGNQKATGCYIYDSRGKRYIDTTMGSGTQIIGHNNQLVRKTINQVKKGTIYIIPNHHTKKVNKLLKKSNPHFHNEYIFCNSGTEANMRAIRLARAYTKKILLEGFMVDGMVVWMDVLREKGFLTK